jgi:hypothetical protein
MLKSTLEKLASVNENACLTISLNTHRTHPDNTTDVIALKNLCHEASEKLIAEHGKRDIQPLLDKLEHVQKEIDPNHNLDSLHIFLSNNVKEIIRSPWPAGQNAVHTGNSFNIRPLIKMANRTEEYLIMLMSNSGVHLFTALNDSITGEIKNGEFPYKDNGHYVTSGDKLSEPRLADNLMKEFLNPVDKALVKVHNETGLKSVVVCTQHNYGMLMQVADKPSAYEGFVPVNYNDVTPHKLASECWKLVQDLQHQRRTAAISEMQEAVGHGKVITDLNEIFRAAREGRGELLIAHNDFRQPVKMNGADSFELASDITQPHVIEDITSDIAWEVISKKGRAVFTSQDEIKNLGNIALKVRY